MLSFVQEDIKRAGARFLIEISRSASEERPPSGNLIENV